MSRATSISTGKAYGLARVCHVWGLPCSTVYWQRQQPKGSGRRRGPQGFHSGREAKGRSGRRPMGAGFFPGVWCSLGLFLGLDPYQGSI